MSRGVILNFLRYYISLSLIFATLPFFSIQAFAASLTTMSIALSTIKQSTAADQTIQMITPTGVAAGETITVVYPTGFNLSSFAVGNVDMAVSSAGSCASFSDVTLASSPSGTTWGVAVSSQTLTFTSGTGTVAAGRCIQIELGSNATHGATGSTFIVNQSAAQNNSDPIINLTAGSSDSGSVAVEIVSDNEVDVSITVAPQITCSVDSNTTNFGTITIGSILTDSETPTWTINTNAASGYSLNVKSTGSGSTAGLYNSGASYTIESATADLSVAASGYGLQGSKTNGDAGSATTTIASPFTASGTNVGALVLTAIPGSGTQLASATGPVSNATVTSTLKAKISALAPTGTYVDTLVFVCTGNY